MTALVDIRGSLAAGGRARVELERSQGASGLWRGGRADLRRPRGRARQVVAVSHARPTVCGVRWRQDLRLRQLVVAAVVGVVAAVGLTLLVDTRAGSTAVPAATAVVQVQVGETLWDVARRVAPASPAAAVVGRIRELNGLDGSSLQAGQQLVVPDGRAGS